MKEQILAVQRMQDYIEKNKTEEIRLSDLARASLFSPWYAYRLFRAALGLTPAEYIRKYRLTQAARQLRGGRVRVIDAAYDAGFSNVDTFTRAFYREFGLHPSDYMRNPVPVPFFIPYGAKYRELRKENIDVSNIQPIFIQVVRKPERLCIIKRGRCAEDYFPYCEEVSCDVWGMLMSMRSLCGEPVAMWLPEKYKKPGTSTYVQGRGGRTRRSRDRPRGVRYHPSAGSRISDVPGPGVPRGGILRGHPHRPGRDGQL